MLVLIRNYGYDVTTGLAEFETKEELNKFIKIIMNLNKNSSYCSMPIIRLYEINYEDIIPLSSYVKEGELDDCENILFLNGNAYTPKNKNLEFLDLEREDKDLIKRYIEEEVF